MINGQAVCSISKLKYGLFPMSFNGCEVIAVYNALEYLGKPQSIENIIRYMRKYAVLLGLFGCNVFRVGNALEHFGVPCSRRKSAEKSSVFIVSSWTGKPLMSTIHTVFCVRDGDKIKVCNRFNSCTDVKIYSRAEDIFKGKNIVYYHIS